WINRSYAGDEDTFNRLFELYAARLAPLAERHITRRVKRHEGPENVVQSVFRTFSQRSIWGELQINDSANLWHFLVCVTLLKEIEEICHGRRQHGPSPADRFSASPGRILAGRVRILLERKRSPQPGQD